jgi:RND superfamily putative drug exporter
VASGLQPTGGLITSLALVLLVPAIMRLLGRANWWAPRPLRRLYARYGISDEIRAERAGVPV